MAAPARGPRAALGRRRGGGDRWIGAQLAQAQARLGREAGWSGIRPTGAWREALREALAAQGASNRRLRADAAIDAGLVVEVGGARLDATPDALLAVRPAVEAALLAEVARAAGRDAADE
ncbi:MAG: hypothetical protein IPF73_15390 [Betaproteobacteria bacterium]|nr:hypothetical protein [Betaproteobacteria bacterium]